VARTILRRLPSDYAHLLASGHFAEEAVLLERLSRPEHLAAAAAAMGPDEAARLADRLLARWGRIGDGELAPAVAIVGPDEVRLGDEPRTITLAVATLGVDDGWEARWIGDLDVAEDGRSAALRLDAPSAGAPVSVSVGVRLIGRTTGKRCALSATKSIRLYPGPAADPATDPKKPVEERPEPR
jgi:hypothetical protein